MGWVDLLTTQSKETSPLEQGGPVGPRAQRSSRISADVNRCCDSSIISVGYQLTRSGKSGSGKDHDSQCTEGEEKLSTADTLHLFFFLLGSGVP